ncbi:uncharacterized protein [Asterias amurensis]|uniref:uncharacterized protein n=1 Tax=Asterias amurensis TaxID=7602 RepID=UPI003AB5B02D
MDKIDMSLDDIIKQRRKETRQLAKQKKPAANLKNRPSGPAGQKQGKKAGPAKAGLQAKGRGGQLKQFRARIGGKKTLAKGVAKFQQQGIAKMNRLPARKIGKQRVAVKKSAGTQVANRYKKQQQQQQQQQQRVQQTKTARQQQFNQRRGIQTIPQTPQTATRKRVNRQNVVNVQANIPQTNQQLSRRQKQKIKRLQQNQQVPKTNFINTQQRQTNQFQPAPKNSFINTQRQNNNQSKKAQRQKPQRVNIPKINPKLLTISISNPRAAQSFKPVKINRKKPAMQVGGTLNDRFGQFQQQPMNVPNNSRRKQQRGRGNSGRTVLLV